MEQHGDDGAHQAGNDHCDDERDADAAGQQEGLAPRIRFEEVDIAAEEAQRHDGQQKAVHQTDPHLLPEELQLFRGGQVLVHQHTDRHGQRPRTDVAGHIQHHGLKADDDGQHGHHRLECADHRGNEHSKEEQGDQPRQTLFHALEDALAQILLAGQAAQFCVIVAHLVIHQLHHVGRGDDADQPACIVQHGERTLGVVHDAVDAVADLFVVGHVGVVPGDQLFQAVVRPGHDEVFQVDGTIELVVLARLFHQLTHGLTDGHILSDADVVGGHAAADLVLTVGKQHPDILGGVLIQLFDDLVLILFFEVIQHVHCIVRVHVRDDLRGLLGGQFFQVRLRIVEVGEDLGHSLHTQHRIQLLTLVRRQGRQRIGKVVLVVVGQTLSQFLLRKAAVDEVQDLFLVVFLLHLGSLPAHSGHKKYTASVGIDLLRCIMGTCSSGRGRLVRLARIAGGALFRVIRMVTGHGNQTPPVKRFALRPRYDTTAGRIFQPLLQNFY